MNANEIRATFLGYFEEKGHQVIASSPVVPHDDPTLLFANAGMNQFKDIFTGKVKPKVPRATTVQKCIRAGGKHNDLDNVGYTTRHLTFFEMLGNFSFGDYFKREAIALAWELVVDRFGLPPDRLWATVYHEDDEARKLWHEVTGLPKERIVGLGEKDNYWSMGDVGPCGPCSEILYDRGDAFGEADIENGERFFEFWNLVFMQFEQSPESGKQSLPHPSIDTGLGLERMAMVLQDVSTVFEIDSFKKLIRRVEEITGADYDTGPAGVPHRVLADHIRSLVFSFADGAEPSNEGRGYVLRRILRRAARYGRKIHSDGPILHLLVDDVVNEMGDSYPEIRNNAETIKTIVRREEERFGETLDVGIELFDGIVAGLRKKSERTISGTEAFKLYDTFGFPVDLVERMAAEIDFEVDLAGFEAEMSAQKERSRGASQFGGTVLAKPRVAIAELPETKFRGYDSTEAQGEVLAAERSDDQWYLVLSDSPFYGEAGGQVGDIGLIAAKQFCLTVEDTQKDQGRLIHTCRLVEGDPDTVRAGEVVDATVDSLRRRAIERNHSATHLLHAALRQLVGTHVRQKGSLVNDARLRFDVTHFNAFTPEELAEAEDIVREQVLNDTPVETFETDYDDAVARGAMALFGEKYGDVVRVVRMGDFSMELCGGTHVERTGQIGSFVLVNEGSVSSGVRRVEALTAAGAEKHHRENLATLTQLGGLLKVAPQGVVSRVEKIIAENRKLKSDAKKQGPVTTGGDVIRKQIGDATFIGAVLEGVPGKELRERYDQFKKEEKKSIVVLLGTTDKLGILTAVSSPLVKIGVDARAVFASMAEILGARGGGRPQLVQAGAVLDPSKLKPALDAALANVESQMDAVS